MNDDFLNAATAPGDLPFSAIVQRLRLQADQWRHDNTLQPPSPTPADPVEIWAASGSRVLIGEAAVRYTTDGSLPTAQSARVPMERVDVTWDLIGGHITRWKGVVPPQPAGTVVRYQVVASPAGASPDDAPERLAQDGQGFWYRFAPEQSVTTFAYRVEPAAPPHPAWLQDAVIYHIFLDRFHPGPERRFQDGARPDGIHGGTFRGVEHALPYLAELGITCLWLSPIGPAPSYHRYDATDYFSVDPALGTGDDLRALVDAAHDRGMRVLLDFVPSHLSSDHPAFRAAVSDPDAPTRSWFVFYEWPDTYRNFLEVVPQLPSVNTEDPGGRRHIIDSALYWVRQAGIDGFRLDHAIGHGMDFWTELRDALAAERDDLVTIGEVTDTPDAVRRYRGRLTDILDFPLAGALRQAFGTRAWSVADLHGFLEAYETYMQDGPGRVSFLDNHDMDRFSWVAGNDAGRLKQALLCQFSLLPPPVIYYGSEIALRQSRSIEDSPIGDAEVRQDMVWDPALWDRELLSFYRAAVGLRRGVPSLRDGARHLLHLDGLAGTYAYLRSAAGNTTPRIGDVVVAFNLGNRPAALALPPAAYQPLLRTGDAVTADRAILHLPPDSAVWLGVA
jgi:glycosidase